MSAVRSLTEIVIYKPWVYELTWSFVPGTPAAINPQTMVNMMKKYLGFMGLNDVDYYVGYYQLNSSSMDSNIISDLDATSLTMKLLVIINGGLLLPHYSNTSDKQFIVPAYDTTNLKPCPTIYQKSGFWTLFFIWADLPTDNIILKGGSLQLGDITSSTNLTGISNVSGKIYTLQDTGANDYPSLLAYTLNAALSVATLLYSYQNYGTTIAGDTSLYDATALVQKILNKQFQSLRSLMQAYPLQFIKHGRYLLLIYRQAMTHSIIVSN